MAGETRRETLYGEVSEDGAAIRMVHDGRFKLIYYPVGNRVQLFDLDADPMETADLGASSAHVDVRNRLMNTLVEELYGTDLDWFEEGTLVGLPERDFVARPDRGLSGNRGLHWPPPPLDDSGRVIGAP